MSAYSSPAAEQGAAAEPPMSRLPVELLLHCLLAADIVTRIRASHVCQTWREAALAERRFWDSFACSRFRNKRHEDAMFALLEAMLLRSRPLPFHLKVPHLDGRPNGDYTERVLRLDALDVFRLAAYHGPTRLFRLLNPTCAPVPNLLCLDVLRLSDDGDPDITTIDLTGQFAARCLPNLRKLAAPNVRFPADGAPFSALRSVTLEGIYGHHHRVLFTHCPSLVRLNITKSPMFTPLPDPPLPPSLEAVSIGCVPSGQIDLRSLMQHWRGVRMRRLAACQVDSLLGILPLFLASHERQVEMRLVGDEDHKVAFSAIPDDESVWTISLWPPWYNDFLQDIEKPASERLRSISVSFSRLGILLASQIHVPGLEKLELRVDNAAHADPLRLQIGDKMFLVAPRLRSVCFNLGDGFAALEEALDLLRTSFRALFIYDSELLDTITVSHRAERACAGFAPFAKEYVLSSTGS